MTLKATEVEQIARKVAEHDAEKYREWAPYYPTIYGEEWVKTQTLRLMSKINEVHVMLHDAGYVVRKKRKPRRHAR